MGGLRGALARKGRGEPVSGVLGRPGELRRAARPELRARERRTARDRSNASVLQPLSGNVATALAGTESTGFRPNGVASDLSADGETAAAAGTANLVDPDATPTSTDTTAGTAGGEGAVGVNGSTVALPSDSTRRRRPSSAATAAANRPRRHWSAGGTACLPSAPTGPAATSSRSPSPAGSGHGPGRHRHVRPGPRTRVRRPPSRRLGGRPGPGVAVRHRSRAVVAERTGSSGPVARRGRRGSPRRVRRGPGPGPVARRDAAAGAADRTLQDVIGSETPVLADWAVGLQFRVSSRLARERRRGGAGIPDPPRSPGAVSTNRWQDHYGGGPLGWTDQLLSAETIPSYLNHDWRRDWGQVEQFTPRDESAVPAELTTETARRSGLWNPGR